MLDRLELAVRRARRALDRDEWTARLLGIPPERSRAGEPGLLVVQIDGLSRARVLEAIAAGRAPFLRSLLEDGTHELVPVYSGLPAMTPAVQAELFYGVVGAVPGFGYVDAATGRVARMYEAAAVRPLESRLAEGRRALLAGGGSYVNVFDGGARHPRFCMASLGWGDAGSSHPLGAAAIAALHGPGIVRATGALAAEVCRALVDLAHGVRAGEDLGSEVKFAQSRVAISVALRELCVFGASVDLARGAPVVHVNLLGYDEMAHRRGPDVRLARREVTPVDAAIRRLAARAARASRRDYDVWVMADHGQEPTRAYEELHGRTVRDAVAEVFAQHGITAAAHEEPREGEQVVRAQALGARVLGFVVPGLDIRVEHRVRGEAMVVAQGSLGHVYAPGPLDAATRDRLARALVAQAHIPLVCAADGPASARAWTREGTFSLPDEAAAVVGADHPYLASVRDDLVALCHHPDAGDLVLSGWHPTDGVSFSHENGAHAGPGPGETDAFLIAPVDTPLPRPPDRPVRFLDVRTAALTVLDHGEPRPIPRRRDAGTAVRLLTYNVHSCVGMDEVCSPERIARVIARHDPDVVALQELDVGRTRTGGVDQAHEIARHLEMELQFHPTITVAEERFGDAILSRLPMRVVRAGMLPGLGSPRLEPRGAIWVEIDAGGGRSLQVCTTHLSLHHRERRMQVDALLGPDWLGSPDARDVVLCGDFNALAWFPVCRSIARRLRDAQARRPGRRPAATWVGRFPIARIDHVFVDDHLEVRHVEVPDDHRTRVASDHRPLLVDLVLPDPPHARG